MPILAKLSTEQYSKIMPYRNAAMEKILEHGPSDRDAVEEAAERVYWAAKLPFPKHRLWFQSPYGAKDEICKLARSSVNFRINELALNPIMNQTITAVDLDSWRTILVIWNDSWTTIGERLFGLWTRDRGNTVGTLAQYGAYDAGRVHLMRYCRDVLNFPWCKEIGHYETLLTAGWWWPFADTVIFSERANISVDNRMFFHNANLRAIEYPDKCGYYFIRGVELPPFVIEDPAKITLAEIARQNNVEIRRIMIERMGWDRFLNESKAKPIHSDDFGTLYRIEVEPIDRWSMRDEPVCLVKVVNSTPEPDGSFKNYILRVNPDCQTARGAVAWTFGMGEDDYRPEFQT